MRALVMAATLILSPAVAARARDGGTKREFFVGRLEQDLVAP